jgi:hypothetical protein
MTDWYDDACAYFALLCAFLVIAGALAFVVEKFLYYRRIRRAILPPPSRDVLRN